MQVRKGKLLAGDSGRKIAEGAIYQRVAEEDRVRPCLCVPLLRSSRVYTWKRLLYIRGENER